MKGKERGREGGREGEREGGRERERKRGREREREGEGGREREGGRVASSPAYFSQLDECFHAFIHPCVALHAHSKK